MMIKIDIKSKKTNWLKGERKINLTKGPQKNNNQKNDDQIKNNNLSQIGIEGWNWKQIKILWKGQGQKLKIKIRRIEVGIPINIRKTLKFYMVSENSRGEERKEGGKRCQRQIVPPLTTCTVPIGR